ncbi:MAG: Ig-like domain-containing protein [Patescibacteria group bacterium]
MDTTAPSVTLSTTSPSTITGAVSIDITVSEDTADLTIADISASSGVVSNFVVQSATGYTVTVTPSDSTGTMMVSI